MPRGNSWLSIFGNTEDVLADSSVLNRARLGRASSGVVIGFRLRFNGLLDAFFSHSLLDNPGVVLAGASELARTRFGGASSGVVIGLSLSFKGLVGAIDRLILYSGSRW